MSASNYANAVRVIESHHADLTTLVAVGGNLGTVLTTMAGGNHTTADFQRRLLEKGIAALDEASPATPGRTTPGMGR